MASPATHQTFSLAHRSRDWYGGALARGVRWSSAPAALGCAALEEAAGGGGGGGIAGRNRGFGVAPASNATRASSSSLTGSTPSRAPPPPPPPPGAPGLPGSGPPASKSARYWVVGESMCASRMRSTAVIGTASTIPVTPQSAAHVISERRTTTGCSRSVEPKSIGSSTLPAKPCAARGSARARTTCTGPNRSSSSTTGMGSSTATSVPTVGTKLSQKPSKPKTSQRSTPSAASETAVARPTSIETPILLFR
mmetsp:Transcript_11871/g.38119  ORF Transcript_11871/g.38119 Transcript_11871/m.38119 type:complete len:252 (+) Transcript_11871:221-976(+)